METMTVRKISTSVLAMYFQVLLVCKVLLPPDDQEKKLSVIKIFKFFVSDHLKCFGAQGIRVKSLQN